MNQSQKAVEEVAVESDSDPIIILNSDGIYVGANEKALQCHGREKDELIGTTCDTILAERKVKAGADLRRIIEGETVESAVHVSGPDGSTYLAKALGTPIERDGETYAKVTTKEIEEQEQGTDTKNVEAETFDHISGAELQEIVRNVRVEAPSGKIPLNAIMLDLAKGHNELEQYKQGALSLHKAIDERLKEEESRNPDSKECDVLREVKRSAFGLYLRVQRGDKELHGERNGKYAGYFN